MAPVLRTRRNTPTDKQKKLKLKLFNRARSTYDLNDYRPIISNVISDRPTKRKFYLKVIGTGQNININRNTVKIGNNILANLYPKCLNVTKEQAELIKKQSEETEYYTILHVGECLKTYQNELAVPANKLVRLWPGDVLGFGDCEKRYIYLRNYDLSKELLYENGKLNDFYFNRAESFRIKDNEFPERSPMYNRVMGTEGATIGSRVATLAKKARHHPVRHGPREHFCEECVKQQNTAE